MSVQACVLSGTLAGPDGTPIQNALVRVRLCGMGGQVASGLASYPVVRPPTVVISGGITVASQAQAIYTDSSGAWSFSLPQGAIFYLEIPVADVRHYGTVPSTATSTFETLLPLLQRMGG